MPNIIDIRDSYRATIAFLPTRVELPILLNERRLFGCGVEIGVQQGEFSETILRYWRGMHLISVDPWLEDAPEHYVDIARGCATRLVPIDRGACAPLPLARVALGSD